MPNPKTIAKWMLEELTREETLYQEEVVNDIVSKFGEEFAYINNNGNLAIDKQVVLEFRILTEKTVVWERGERFWRFREDYDNPETRFAE